MIGDKVPLEDQCADLIVADFVLEHISTPTEFVNEVNRLLKPGGYFCARTPHKYNYVAIIARLVGNRFHKRILEDVQPSRKAEDVFDTSYKLNTIREVSNSFYGWDNSSFIFKSPPSYYFGFKIIYSIMNVVHNLAPSFFVGCVFVFVRKPELK